MRKYVFSALAATLLLLVVMGSSVSAQGPVASARLPFRSVNANYHAIKAQIDTARPAAPAAGPSAPTGLAPTSTVQFQGQSATVFSPSDANGAVGTTEYIQSVNVSVAVYNRSGTLLSTGTQSSWTGFANASGDAQVIYSPGDQRFYASMLSFNPFTGAPPYYLIYGFSKGNSPSAAATDWCFYQSSFGGKYGTILPDYPKLGQTKDFILIGVNDFDSSNNFNYTGSDIAWVKKPAVGTITTCPSALMEGVKQNIKNADGTQAGTPVPGNQTDASSTGYVIANEDPGSGTSTVLSVYRVHKNSTTGAAVFSSAKNVSVPAYAYPPSAPQKGTTDTLDTLDARLTNAVLAPDPRYGTTALWTQHTVAGGAGAQVRWYEINPATGAILQKGVVTSSSLYVFMAAVSPDRNGATHKFGSNMVVAFSTSSSSAKPAAGMVSKVGANAQSSIVTVATSSASDTDFSCSPVCRWGDYAGASPDPASTTGQVWATVEMANGGTSSTAAWTTEIWQANP